MPLLCQFLLERGFRQAAQLPGTLGGKARVGISADIAQHSPSLNRGQLITIAEKDHSRMIGQGVDQSRHHRKIDH